MDASLTIVVAGRIGTGKSALVNALIGGRKEEANVSSNITLGRETDQLASYTYKSKKDERITIWDSPGLEYVYVSTPEELEVFVRAMEEKIGSLNLLLYCTKMNEHRLSRQGDSQSIRVLTKVFGESIWKNAVFVLTFANELPVPGSRKDQMDDKEYFKDTLGRWERQLRQELMSLGVPRVVASRVPVIPAGDYKKHNSLGCQNDWLSELWDVCLDHEAMKDRSQPVVLKVNEEQLRVIKEQIRHCHIDLSRSQLTRVDHESRWTSSGIGRLVTVGSVALVGVGGVVGSLLGGPMGAVTGVGLGIAGGGVMVYGWYRLFKE